MPHSFYENPFLHDHHLARRAGKLRGASNSQQTPKLPDWAILDLSVPLAERVGGKGVVDANFFGERWEFKSGTK